MGKVNLRSVALKLDSFVGDYPLNIVTLPSKNIVASCARHGRLVVLDAARVSEAERN